MLMTSAEYMAVDSQLPTSDSLNDGQIIEMVIFSQSSQAGSDEDEEGEEEGASVEGSACHPVQWLMQLTLTH